MRTVRQSIFETNSSSTHALTYTPKEKWDRFAAGDPDLIWLRFNPLPQDGPYDKTDNIVTAKEYAEYLCKNDPDGIGSLPLEFVVTFIRLAVSNSALIDNLRWKLIDHNEGRNYRDMKEVSNDFTEVGDHCWDKSSVTEVQDGSKTYVKACAVWFDG